jgi:hypothetical protein
VAKAQLHAGEALLARELHERQRIVEAALVAMSKRV